jgi:hypothetical protein
MPGIIARGRIAWILALVFGVVLIVAGAIGAANKEGWGGWLLGIGAAFALFGLIFLILSFVTKGQTD